MAEVCAILASATSLPTLHLAHEAPIS